jgi:maltoporin
VLGDGPDAPNASMTLTPAIAYNMDKVPFVPANPAEAGWNFGMRQAFIEMINFIGSAQQITLWASQRFYDRHDLNLQDFFFDDYSGYGMGIDRKLRQVSLCYTFS